MQPSPSVDSPQGLSCFAEVAANGVVEGPITVGKVWISGISQSVGRSAASIVSETQLLVSTTPNLKIYKGDKLAKGAKTALIRPNSADLIIVSWIEVDCLKVRKDTEQAWDCRSRVASLNRGKHTTVPKRIGEMDALAWEVYVGAHIDTAVGSSLETGGLGQGGAQSAQA